MGSEHIQGLTRAHFWQAINVGLKVNWGCSVLYAITQGWMKNHFSQRTSMEWETGTIKCPGVQTCNKSVFAPSDRKLMLTRLKFFSKNLPDIKSLFWGVFPPYAELLMRIRVRFVTLWKTTFRSTPYTCLFLLSYADFRLRKCSTLDQKHQKAELKIV